MWIRASSRSCSTLTQARRTAITETASEGESESSPSPRWRRCGSERIAVNWGTTRRRELLQHLGLYTVIWPTPELVERTAQLRVRQQRKGRRLSAPDAWIAATALMLNCPLATHDHDYSDVDGLSLIEARG